MHLADFTDSTLTIGSVQRDTETASMAVDRSDGRPLHVQVRDCLHAEISSGRLQPGSALPTEDELQRQFGVARSVIRQALGSLVDIGLINRSRGRGSVVAPTPVLRRSIQRAGGLNEQATMQGQRLSTHVLSVEDLEPPNPAREALGTIRTTRIERVRHLEETPVAYMMTWIPADLFPNFTAQLLEGNSLLALMRAHGRAPAGGPRQVQAVSANEMLARHLNVDPGDPLLLLEGVTRDTNGMGLEWFRVWHRQNTVFDVDAHVADEDNNNNNNNLSLERLSHLQTLVADLQTAIQDLGTRKT
ncbi:GntR family transcriptional regulator [Rhodococcus sp. 06-621-2]|nr:GntR family transcriptional regulator [Rhodococcus sp. 06-621-2]